MSPESAASIVRSVPCGKCGARRGWECTTPTGRLTQPHQARVMADLFKTTH